MAHVSPLRDRHAQAEAVQSFYGPVESQVEVVETYGELDFEYAALRKACVLLDQPQRGTIEIAGEDAPAFLGRMVTQDLASLEPLRWARSLWLGRKGRIVSDWCATRLDESGVPRFVVDLDIHAARRTIETLDEYVIADDVELRDASDRTHRLALHGPTAALLLDEAGEGGAGGEPSSLREGEACVRTIAGREALVLRCDTAGVPGFELVLASDAAVAVYTALLELGQPINGDGDGVSDPGTGGLAGRVKLRPAGWLAYNTARIEAGTPLFNIDFGDESLPAELGERAFEARVNMEKGCYLGQEVVARMHNLGQPKQVLVGLRPSGDNLRDERGRARQPIGGERVYEAGGTGGDPIGVVTSSTISPMRGGEPICFAVVRSKHAVDGRGVELQAEGVRLSATIRRSLAFMG